jgi:hypothetical protein
VPDQSAIVWELLTSPSGAALARHRGAHGITDGHAVRLSYQFPLDPTSQRATSESGEVDERPLLLDPTVDDPEPHLEFRPDGTVFPALVAGQESARGRATIDVVALMRRDLVDERARTARETEAAIEHVRRTVEDIKYTERLRLPPQAEAQRLAELRGRLAADVADMEAKTSPEAEFSMLATTMVRAFKSTFGL